MNNTTTHRPVENGKDMQQFNDNNRRGSRRQEALVSERSAFDTPASQGRRAPASPEGASSRRLLPQFLRAMLDARPGRVMLTRTGANYRPATYVSLVLLLGIMLAAPMARAATHYQILVPFPSSAACGAPLGPMLQGRDGLLYGITGPNNGQFGAVFRVKTDGSAFTILHEFLTASGADGATPLAGMIEGSDGALYGTTRDGGDYGYGTLFKLNKDGSGFAVLHSFGDGIDGYWQDMEGLKENELLQASDGAIYGTTDHGGANDSGVIYRINTNGSAYTILFNFDLSSGYPNPDRGCFPAGGLTEGSDGALYGTTASGGPGDDQGGGGVVFKVAKDGSGYALLHSFSSLDVDCIPGGTLLLGSDGVLYGTTQQQFLTASNVVFRIDQNGSSYQVLHVFPEAPNGTADQSSYRLQEGKDGALYGIKSRGGTNSVGIAFMLKKDGSGFAVLHAFGDDGAAYPGAGLVRGMDGIFYGAYTCGGPPGTFGGLYKLWPPQTPDLLGVTKAGNAMQVTFAGTSGARYQLLRSTNLVNWALLATVTMPPLGLCTNLDSTPPAPNAFYRAAWTH
jgi:uncharacterized repeat protein (TIGR03803 family)